jgi:release factor glutamine methyltransferase
LSVVLHQAAQKLAAAGVDSPRLTAEALLAHTLGLSRAQLLARPEQPFSPEKHSALASLVERAAQGEPLAYLSGRREFHSLDFLVDARVLVPRPETELLVDEALRFLETLPAGADPHVLDVGTGSGCIAVALAVKCPRARVTAVDVSSDALDVARVNAARHGVLGRVAFFKSDLLSGLHLLRAGFQLLVANLPYIPSAALGELPVARHEPRLALDGGPDGLLWVRRLLVDAPRVMAAGGRLLLEIEDHQGATAAALAQRAFPRAQVAVHPDFAGLDRILSIALT